MIDPVLIPLSDADKAILRKLIAHANANEGIPRETAAEIMGALSHDALWKLQGADPEDVAYTAKCCLPWWEQKIVNVKLNSAPGLVEAIIEQIRMMQMIAREKLAPRREVVTVRIA